MICVPGPRQDEGGHLSLSWELSCSGKPKSVKCSDLHKNACLLLIFLFNSIIVSVKQWTKWSFAKAMEVLYIENGIGNMCLTYEGVHIQYLEADRFQ